MAVETTIDVKAYNLIKNEKNSYQAVPDCFLKDISEELIITSLIAFPGQEQRIEDISPITV